jgi:hypothetical protein
MIKTLSTRVFKRSGASRLSITLLPLINTILVKVTRHREKILNEILVLVYKFLFTEAIDEDELSLVSGDIGALQTLLNHYVDNMHEHQQTLDFYLQSFQKQDTSSKAGIVLEEYTTQLMALIDRTILYTTNTCRRLAEWRLALSRIENCELNN